MLTAALRVYRWDKATSSISSDRLEAEAVPLLEPALAVYRARLPIAEVPIRYRFTNSSLRREVVVEALRTCGRLWLERARRDRARADGAAPAP